MSEVVLKHFTIIVKGESVQMSNDFLNVGERGYSKECPRRDISIDKPETHKCLFLISI
jgi:hypothetical protein